MPWRHGLVAALGVLASCSKEPKVVCHDATRCFVRSGQCASGLTRVEGKSCVELGFSVACGELWFKPEVACDQIVQDAGVTPAAGADAGVMPASLCAGRGIGEPLATPPTLESAACEFELLTACGVGPTSLGVIGTRTVQYPICAPISLEPLPKRCGADGAACVVAERKDTERCRPPALDEPDFQALLGVLCAPSATATTDGGAQEDAGPTDAGSPTDAGPLDACALFQQTKATLGLSEESLAALEAAVCQDAGASGP